jgi:hypothetical protein
MLQRYSLFAILLCSILTIPSSFANTINFNELQPFSPTVLENNVTQDTPGSNDNGDLEQIKVY